MMINLYCHLTGCHPGYFECNNGQCIKNNPDGSSIRCDNSPDCGDDSDEKGCPKGKSIVV